MLQIFRSMYIKSAGSSADCTIDENILSHLDLFTTERLYRMLIVFSDLLNELKTSFNHRLSFEIAFAKICDPKCDLTLESLAERIADLELVATVGDLNPAHVKNQEVEVSQSDEHEYSEENYDLNYVEEPLESSSNVDLEDEEDDDYEYSSIEEDLQDQDDDIYARVMAQSTETVGEQNPQSENGVASSNVTVIGAHASSSPKSNFNLSNNEELFQA